MILLSVENSSEHHYFLKEENEFKTSKSIS